MKLKNPTFADIPGLRALWAEAFGDSDAFLDSFFATAFSPERCLCVAQDEKILCAAYWIPVWLEEGEAAYVYALATAKAHRGKGLAHRICDQIHERLKKQGYLAAILVPGESGLGKFYEEMGYRFFGGVEQIGAIAETPGAILRRISGAEYEILRRQYLPAGAVIQEGYGIDFLADYADLYAGEDFLLAAWQENETVSGLEFLGNREMIPHILQALGAKQGSFRGPGSERFAMWLPFAPCVEPTYFGLPFD